jgi:hypothetical protein
MYLGKKACGVRLMRAKAKACGLRLRRRAHGMAPAAMGRHRGKGSAPTAMGRHRRRGGRMHRRRRGHGLAPSGYAGRMRRGGAYRRLRRGGNIFKKIWNGVKSVWNSGPGRAVRGVLKPFVKGAAKSVIQKYAPAPLQGIGNNLVDTVVGSGRHRRMHKVKQHMRGLHLLRGRKGRGMRHHKRRHGGSLALPEPRLLSY